MDERFALRASSALRAKRSSTIYFLVLNIVLSKSTWKEKRNFRASNENRPLRSSRKTFRSGRVPPTPATCHSPMTNISVMRPLR